MDAKGGQESSDFGDSQSKTHGLALGVDILFSECPSCHLEAWSDEQCCFCGEIGDRTRGMVGLDEDHKQQDNYHNRQEPKQHNKTPHKPTTTVDVMPPQQVVTQDSSLVTSDAFVCRDHGTQEGRVGGEASRDGRRGSVQLDHSTDSSSHGRGQGEHQGRPRSYPEGQTPETPPSSSKQGHLDGTPQGLGYSSKSQQDDCSDGVTRGRRDSLPVRARQFRDGGFWQVWQSDIPAGLGRADELHLMGADNQPGVRQSTLEVETTGTMGTAGETSDGNQDQDVTSQSINPHNKERGLQHQEGREQRRQLLAGELGRCISDQEGTGGGGTTPSDPTEKDGSRARPGGSTRDGKVGDESHGGAPQEPQGDVSAPPEPEILLSTEAAANLAKHWHVQRNPFSRYWQDLVWTQRPLLVELACFPESVLSKEVEQRFGAGSAVRLSEWNGANLETKAGVEFAKHRIRELRPVHLWIACECSPYCPLQHLNRRTPEQAERLEAKQAKARQQYKGAIQVAEEAWSIGTEVHWELSQRCQAWKLDFIQDYEHRHSLKKVSCHGCAVGLRTRDGKAALCKAWTIATKNQQLLQHLDLQCQKNHPRGKCERGETAHTACYTTPFARKVVDSLSECEVWSRILEELQDRGPEQQSLAAEAAPDSGEQLEISAEDREEIEKKIQKIHSNTGHSSMKNLIRALELRAVHPKVLQVAKSWTCKICQHRHRTDPRRFATLETIPQKWERVQIDMFTWMQPKTKEKHHVLLIIDEATRFRMTRIASTGRGNTTNWDQIRKILEEQWFAIFGHPKVIRVDPAGPWMSDSADNYLSEKGIELVPIPGESHWQIGIVEGAAKSLKGVAERMCAEFPDMDAVEVLARSTWVCNNEEQFKGYTPIQQTLGRAPDEYGHMFEDSTIRPVHPSLLEDGGFREDIKARETASKAFAEEVAKRRLERAERMGHRRLADYLPGDLVFYWRKQVPVKEKTTQHVGRFLGPARVLATETRRTQEGDLRPGSIVWLHRAGRLIKAAPEQLRKASPYEQQVETLKGPVELPWTITSIATDPQRRTYVDVSKEVPTEAEWEKAEVEETGDNVTHLLAPRYRHVTKSPVRPPTAEEAHARKESRMDHEEDVHMKSRPDKRSATEAELQEQQQQRPGDRDMEVDEEYGDNAGGPSSSHSGLTTELEAFYVHEENLTAVEISIELPESRRGIQKLLANPEAYVCSQLRKRQIEVNEKKLTKEEAMKFAGAKDKEVRNFVASESFEAARKQVAEHKVVGMRWLLTWKVDEHNNRTPKARAIILGYQDPQYPQRPTAAPTPSRAGRQLFLQLCAWKKLRLAKGDISGAFLQGDDLEEELYVRPVEEITTAYKLPKDTVMLLRKAAYGLVQAPLHWHQSVNRFLKSLGYRQLEVEPCCWIWTDKTGTVRSAVHAHVDDFLFAGGPQCEIHQRLMTALQQRFKWGTWEVGKFVQCGIDIHQNQDYSIDMHQTKFINDLEEIRISRDRSRQTECPTTEQEKSVLRGALGSLSWLTGQTVFLFAADVNILLTKVPNSTVNEINETNKLIRAIKKTANQIYKIHTFPSEQTLELAVWTDAAHANRPNGVDSTEGIFVGMSNHCLREGQEAKVTAIHWRSGKIERICRSPASAETLAGLDGEDDLSFLRFLWAEMQGLTVTTTSVDKSAKQVPGLFITDAKNLFDKLVRATPTVKGAEKRSSIEALSLRQNLNNGAVQVCWVDGGGMLANVLTKVSEKGQGWLYLQLGQRWKIRHDQLIASQKKRRAAGLSLIDLDGAQYSPQHTRAHTMQQESDQHKQQNQQQQQQQHQQD